MTACLGRCVVRAAAWVAAAFLFAGRLSAQTLDVPYLPQTEDLCGGAAAAMVMRYWGAEDVYPRQFEHLVDRSAQGIKTGALVGDLRARGWSAVAGSGTAAEIARELARGRPVIALIEDRPGRYHYVVVVSSTSETVVVHDPARAPARAIPPARFDAAWQKADRWMLILLPPSAPLVPNPRPDPLSGSISRPDPCAAAVEEAVGRAGSDRGEARRLLERAATACPAAGAPWRELAGLDALDGDWASAARRAHRAVELEATDEHAWRVLATARYMLRDDMAALEAWNHVGEPVVNLLDVKGLERTRYPIVADAIGVGLERPLTPAALRLAQRRVRDVPSLAAARVGFHPIEQGKARIDVSVFERARAPSTLPSWIGIGLAAATDREMSAKFASVTGGGDLVALAWRWWEHRPRIAGSYAAPAPGALGGGIWRLDAIRETQTFGREMFEETRTTAALSLTDWITDRLRFTAGGAFDRWSSRPRTFAASGRIELWPVVERLALEAGMTQWAGRQPFALMDASAHWRSSRTATAAGTVWLARGGYVAATTGAPASVWPGADTGHARGALLRAHPLLDDGVIVDGVFGRRLAFAGVEIQRWTAPRRSPLRLASAVFVDTGRASRGLAGTDERAHVDAGAGLRIAIPAAGVLRIDVARGLRDGRTALSVGFERR